MATIESLQEEEYNKEHWEAEEKTALQKLADEPDRLFHNHKHLSIIYGFMHRHDECVFHAEKAIALAKNGLEKSDTRVLIARSHVFRKEINLAIAEYLVAHDEDPEHEVVVEELAHCYKHLKDYDNALSWYKILGTLEDCRPMAYCFIAEMYFEKKEYDAAVESYMEALTADAEYADAIHGIGVAHAEAGRNEQAMSWFIREKELFPESASPLFCIGLIYQRQEDYYRALHYYTEALKLQPDFAEVYNNIAKIHLDMDGDVKTALAELEKAAELATDSKQRTLFYLNLSRLYSAIKDDEKHLYWKKKFLNETFGGLLSWEDDEEDDDGDVLK